MRYYDGSISDARFQLWAHQEECYRPRGRNSSRKCRNSRLDGAGDNLTDKLNHNAALSDTALRIFVVVQSSYDFAINCRQQTGVQRVETEIAKVLIARNHTAVIWDPDMSTYVEVPPWSFSDPTTAFLTTRQDATGIQSKHVARLRLGVALSLIFPKIGSLRDGLIKRLIVLFGRTARALSIVERRVIARLLKFNRRIERRNLFLAESKKSIVSLARVKVDLQTGDVLLVPSPLGFTLATSQFSAMAERGVHIVPVIYDLYAVRTPWVHLSPEHEISVAQDLALFSHVSDLVLAISNWTACDIVAWYVEQNLRVPHIVPVPLAAGLRPSSDIAPVQPKGFPFASGRFVLMSGSFSRVKNQSWAQMLWWRLYERLGDVAWPLVFAGQRVHKQDETIGRIQMDLGFGRTMYWVSGPSDAELSWLYMHCAFTIVPSEFEGWGLALSEGLAFGKPCLSSGRGALVEAGQGIAWERDPIDGVAWLDQCSRLMTDPEFLAAEHARIRRDYRQRTWEDVADEIIRAIQQNVVNFDLVQFDAKKNA